MLLSTSLFALAASLSTSYAQVYQGFNYGSTNTDGSPVTQSYYQNLFTTAQNLVGTSAFTSARLYTMIQAGTTNAPIEAIPAAIATKTSLLLGLWASAGQSNIDNEIAALKSAINQYGTAFTGLIAGISVGSEDLYRISPTGIINKSGVGAQPADVVNYIGQVRAAIQGTSASSKPVGHVDTWTAWVNSTNDAVIAASDFIGMDAYPYFQTTMANSIENGNMTFFDAYDATLAAVGSKPVWITETGWPVSGPTENQAVASLANARTYWDQVGCAVFGKITTYWYTLQDSYPNTPSPSFGIVGSTLSDTPLYDLTCPSKSSSVANKVTSSSLVSSASSVGSSATIVQSPGPVATSSTLETSAVQSPGPVATSTTLQTSVVQSPGPIATSITLKTSGVAATSSLPASSNPAPAPPSSAASSPVATIATITTTSVLPSATTTSSSCPAKLVPGKFEFPHLIVPVDSAQPNKAGGTSYNGTISFTVSSIFNFDIPASDAGKTCSLIFLLPTQSKLVTSAYSLSGTGGIDVAQLTAPATQSTSYNTVPAVKSDLGTTSIEPGSSYVIATQACAAGQRVAFEVSATGSLALNYFQDSNEPGIGLYISVC